MVRARRPQRGMGKPGFPIPRLEGLALPRAGRGKPGFSISLLERHSVATKVTTPSPALPRWGRESGSSPSGGGWEGGCGAACANVKISPWRGEWGNQVSPHSCSSSLFSR